MLTRRSLTSRLWLGLAVCGGLLLAWLTSWPVASAHAQQTMAASAVPVAANTIRVHFRRVQNDTDQWGVYSWEGPAKPSSAWILDRFMFSQTDAFGGYADIALASGKTAMWFLVTDGSGNKNCGADQGAPLPADVATKGHEIWLLEGDCTVYTTPPSISYGNLANANAHWLSTNTIAWPGVPAGASYKLVYAANGGLGSGPEGVLGADSSMALTPQPLPQALRDKFPPARRNRPGAGRRGRRKNPPRWLAASSPSRSSMARAGWCK
nr:pullulanase-associated domain-containing protein [Massilia sp. Dwa41.01b]